MGYRITGLRAIVIPTAIAVIGLTIPAALIAATSPEPAPVTPAAFAPVVIPAADGTPDFESRVLSTELRDDYAPPADVAPAPRSATLSAKALPQAVDPAAKVIPQVAVAARGARGASAPTFSTAGLTAARARVIKIALAQLNDRYVSGGTGPDTFDCSGLVRYAYQQAGVGGALGGGHSASAMLSWGRANGLTSRTNGRPGDVVIYGNGSHAGIYIGNGKIVSALNSSQGIRVTGIYALGAPFTAFIHTRI